MKILRLTESDYSVLMMMLGMATGTASKDGAIPDSFKKLVDWIIVQGGNEHSYTYFTDKQTIKAIKEDEIAREK
jgi:hypothetical protein